LLFENLFRTSIFVKTNVLKMQQKQTQITLIKLNNVNLDNKYNIENVYNNFLKVVIIIPIF
jgi:hypothetical protein